MNFFCFPCPCDEAAGPLKIGVLLFALSMEDECSLQREQFVHGYLLPNIEY
jgi:hypothetical protein